VGQHSYNTFNAVNINMPDFGSAFLPENQDRTLTPSATPGATALQTNQLRPIRGYGSITMQLNRGLENYHSLQLSFQRRFRNGLSFGFNDTVGLYDRQQSAARLQHNPDGSFSYRADQAEADALLGDNNPVRHTMRGNFVWDLPDLRSNGIGLKTLGYVINDWQLSGIWAGATGSTYSVGFGYQSGGGNMNLTGSPEYAARIRIAGDPGSGCSGDVLRQFDATAFTGPTTNSGGLESGTNYLKGCFRSALDLSIAEHQVRRRPDRAAACGRLQCPERGDRHQPEYDGELRESGHRHDDDYEPAVRSGNRCAGRGPIAPARRGRRGGDGIPEPSHRAGAGSLLILSRPTAKHPLVSLRVKQ
jgi:hypothetical protein